MTDGIRTLALCQCTIDSAPSSADPLCDFCEGEGFVEPKDDGFTGEIMETQKPSALAEAVFTLCRPGGQTPAAADVVAKAVADLDRLQSVICGSPTPADEKAQAIRLAREAVDRAEEKLRLADREAMEAQLALRELDGREDEPQTRYLRAWLSGDFAAAREARIESAALNFLRYGHAPAADIADRVTERVAALRILADKH